MIITPWFVCWWIKPTAKKKWTWLVASLTPFVAGTIDHKPWLVLTWHRLNKNRWIFLHEFCGGKSRAFFFPSPSYIAVFLSIFWPWTQPLLLSSMRTAVGPPPPNLNIKNKENQDDVRFFFFYSSQLICWSKNPKNPSVDPLVETDTRVGVWLGVVKLGHCQTWNKTCGKNQKKNSYQSVLACVQSLLSMSSMFSRLMLDFVVANTRYSHAPTWGWPSDASKSAHMLTIIRGGQTLSTLH